MEYIAILIIVLSFISYIFFSKFYDNQARQKEFLLLIRELTTSLKSTNLESYTNGLPDYPDTQEKKPEIIKDEFVDIDQVEPLELLKAISKK